MGIACAPLGVQWPVVVAVVVVLVVLVVLLLVLIPLLVCLSSSTSSSSSLVVVFVFVVLFVVAVVAVAVVVVVVSAALARLTEADAFRTTSRLSYCVSSPLIYCSGITSELDKRIDGQNGQNGARIPGTFGMCVFKSVRTTALTHDTTEKGKESFLERRVSVTLIELKIIVRSIRLLTIYRHHGSASSPCYTPRPPSPPLSPLVRIIPIVMIMRHSQGLIRRCS